MGKIDPVAALRKVIAESGIGQNAFAGRVGVTPSWLSRLLSGGTVVMTVDCAFAIEEESAKDRYKTKLLAKHWRGHEAASRDR